MAGDFDPRDLDSREPDDGIRDRDDQWLVLGRGPASPREDSLDEDARDRNDDWLEERDGKRRRFDGVLVHKLDRLGRSLRHLLFTIDTLVELKISFSSLNEGIDTASPAGRLSLHILGAMAEFERSRISERVRLRLARAKAQGVNKALVNYLPSPIFHARIVSVR